MADKGAIGNWQKHRLAVGLCAAAAFGVTSRGLPSTSSIVKYLLLFNLFLIKK
jgi:hypothetical protein